MTAIATIVALQYLGSVGPSGSVDATYLVVLGLTLPVVTYALAVACENVDWVSQWDRMVRDDN
jgi:hypothetical protein